MNTEASLCAAYHSRTKALTLGPQKRLRNCSWILKSCLGCDNQWCVDAGHASPQKPCRVTILIFLDVTMVWIRRCACDARSPQGSAVCECAVPIHAHQKCWMLPPDLLWQNMHTRCMVAVAAPFRLQHAHTMQGCCCWCCICSCQVATERPMCAQMAVSETYQKHLGQHKHFVCRSESKDATHGQHTCTLMYNPCDMTTLSSKVSGKFPTS